MHTDLLSKIDLLENPAANSVVWGIFALPGETEATLFMHSLDADRNSGSLHFLMQPFFLQGKFPAINLPLGETIRLRYPFPDFLNNLDCKGWESGDVPVDLKKSEFVSYVSESSGQLNDAHKKVMCARTKQESKLRLQPFQVWEKMRKAYPQTYTWFFTSPYTGTWLGASPELLLASDGLDLRSVSLAGTRRATENAGWGEKEIEEQALVTDYIVNCFEGFGLMNVSRDTTETLKFGSIEHLKTEVNGLAFLPDPEGLRNLAIRLHPTPAVGGIPKEWSLSQIKLSEGENRSYYSGYVGIWDSQQNYCRLYVNLRCLQWYSDKTILYAGAGITAASEPEKEWVETEEKMSALRNVLWQE
jgi:isochorismate synthase